MNELITINYENESPTVNGRELHKKLGIETPYHKWFPRMCEYGFKAGKDFRTEDKNVHRQDGTIMPQIQSDHYLTISMAKELCMLQRSEMGRQFRQYFISIEEAWNSPEKIMERALAIAHQRAIEAEKRIMSLSAENEELAAALNTSLEYWTVMKYNTEKHKHWSMAEYQSIGRRMAAFCRMHGYEVKACLTNDDRFTKVNSYPITAWSQFMEVAQHERA